MSDLFCPATLILARHGEAEYERDLRLEPVKPFARNQGGSLTATGRRQARELAELLHSRGLSHIYSSTLARAVQTAEIAAAALHLDVTTRLGLQESRLDETLTDTAHRLADVIEEISDLHRGETVLLIAHQHIIQRGLAQIGGVCGPIDEWNGYYTSTIEIQVDADGIVCTAWDQAE